MDLIVTPSRLSGSVDIPGSKSHTIRAVAIAALAPGESRITAPLRSADTVAAIAAYRALGAEIDDADEQWTVKGFDGRPACAGDAVDVRNSGTTLRIAAGSSALLTEGTLTLDGDAQIRRRPIAPLLDSLNDLGAQAVSLQDNGCAPIRIGGRLRGGRTRIEAVTSQYLSSLLINTPLADGDSEIDVPLLHEKPYVYITLDWLERGGITLERDELRRFRVPGKQSYRPLDVRVPADFSSATFFLAAGALGDNAILVRGLDMNDTQGDKAVVDYLRQLGANLVVTEEGIQVRPGELRGCDLDLNATPDALPMMAVVACFARGRTRLLNVPQARLKETDRIHVMCEELTKMGATIREMPDGLEIEQRDLRGAAVHGHDDHRVVMSLAIAGTRVPGRTRITTAEAINVTYPTFVDSLRSLGGSIDTAESA